MADTILLTNPIHPDGEALLAGRARLVVAPDTTPDTLRRLAADADGIIVRAKLPDDILDAAPRVKGLVRHGVGLDFIPVEAATARGVRVANLPGSNARAVAEYVFAALLSLRRPLLSLDGELRSDGWFASRKTAESTAELGGQSLGIVGVGTIGSQIARIAGDGLGMHVLGASRRSGRMPQGVEEVSLDALFSCADTVVLSCALTDDTRGLVDGRRLALMKPGAVLINVSRGAVVDSEALVTALQSGALAGAVCDVFEEQPLPEDNPLLRCPNLILTPHVAAITATSLRGMSVGAAEEMRRILDGQDPVNFVNPECRQV